jgi:hypothetical protein
LNKKLKIYIRKRQKSLHSLEEELNEFKSFGSYLISLTILSLLSISSLRCFGASLAIGICGPFGDLSAKRIICRFAKINNKIKIYIKNKNFNQLIEY